MAKNDLAFAGQPWMLLMATWRSALWILSNHPLSPCSLRMENAAQQDLPADWSHQGVPGSISTSGTWCCLVWAGRAQSSAGGWGWSAAPLQALSPGARCQRSQSCAPRLRAQLQETLEERKEEERCFWRIAHSYLPSPHADNCASGLGVSKNKKICGTTLFFPMGKKHRE